MAAPAPEPERAAPIAAKARKLGNKERKELQEIPGRISTLESELEELHRRMAEPGFYKNAPADIQAATARTLSIPQELDRLFARWAELENGSVSLL